MTRDKRDGSGQKRALNEFGNTNLHIALGNIKRGDSSVCGTASQNATRQALGIIRSVMRHWAEVPFQGVKRGQFKDDAWEARRLDYLLRVPFF